MVTFSYCNSVTPQPCKISCTKSQKLPNLILPISSVHRSSHSSSTMGWWSISLLIEWQDRFQSENGAEFNRFYDSTWLLMVSNHIDFRRETPPIQWRLNWENCNIAPHWLHKYREMQKQWRQVSRIDCTLFGHVSRTLGVAMFHPAIHTTLRQCFCITL